MGKCTHVNGLCLHTLKCWSVHADRGGGGVLLSKSNELKTIMGHRADLGMLLPRHKICIRCVFWELLRLVIPQRTCILPLFKVIDSYNFCFLFCL